MLEELAWTRRVVTGRRGTARGSWLIVAYKPGMADWPGEGDGKDEGEEVAEVVVASEDVDDAVVQRLAAVADLTRQAKRQRPGMWTCA